MWLDIVLYVFLPLANYSFWYIRGFYYGSCYSTNDAVHISCNSKTAVFDYDRNYIDLLAKQPLLLYQQTKDIVSYRKDNLPELKFPSHLDSTIVNVNKRQFCTSNVNPYVSIEEESCIALTFVDSRDNYNLLRYTVPVFKSSKAMINNDSTRALLFNGFFQKVEEREGRDRQHEYMLNFLANLPDIAKYVRDTLENNGIVRGNDIILMVVNMGEIDLLLNFICSCKKHGIIIFNIVVFTSSHEVLSLVESNGMVCISHRSFLLVQQQASQYFLDSIFTDMMWYKSFSVWLLLHLGYSVLYQDVDIIWYKHPLEYILSMQQHRNYDMYVTDDGQRTVRFSPFYTNSGFFYMSNNERCLYFSYSILTSYAYLLATGSHQFLFQKNLLEAIDNFRILPFILEQSLFPGGIKVHHDKPYMRGLKDGIIQPYLFHMCWTKNKQHKITNFKDLNMWYINDTYNISIDNLLKLYNNKNGKLIDYNVCT